MAKRDMKSALASTLKAENEAVRERFDRADSLIFDKPPLVESSLRAADLPQEEKVDASASPTKKLIRDTFSLPADDYELIAVIQQRCLQSALNVTKGEIVRAGLKLLHTLPDKDLKQALESVEKLKPGKRATKK